MIKDISAVVLAGGTNSRFNGQIKSKILVDGKTIISRILETISGIFTEIIIVTNTPSEFTEYQKYKIVGDNFICAGPLGGIHAALRATSKDAVFVFAGDMPLVQESMIMEQIEYFKQNNCEILVPEVGDLIEPLHAIYSTSIMKPVEEWLTTGNKLAVRDFLKNRDHKFFPVKLTDNNRNAFFNINTPADILLVESIINKSFA